MQHYTNKKTNEVFGYESESEAKRFNQDYKNLVKMSDELFKEYRDNRPVGGEWTYRGWKVNSGLKAQEEQAMKEAQRQELMKEKASAQADMQMHLLLDDKEQAKECALKIKELDAKIEAL